MNPSIHIMLMDMTLHAHAELEQQLLPSLHHEEQARYRRFSHPQRRQTWLAGRALSLAALARVSGHAEAAALRTDADGAIRYQDGGTHISLSHCRELLAVAVSGECVGVDLEWPRPRKSLQHADEVFSESEARQLRSLPQAARQDAFYTLWTLKEAACKAAGVSLWTSLRDARFDLAAARFEPDPSFPAGSWHFMSASIEPGWRLAVALRDADAAPAIVCWRLHAPGDWRHQPLARQVFLRGE